ncbi:hypothetical protein HZB05_01350 [Candidatus Wolfebacteria bacterium]|nr:hypothetical protein [Candidatus Wolfebacteria bacterium]
MYVFTARKNQRLIVTNRQFSIIIGSLLGDAYISPLGKIQFEQSDKQSDYLKWKFSELKNISYNKISYVERNKNGVVTKSYRFWTRQFFRPLREMFYKDGRKHISDDLLELISPFSLAVWHMDDGHFEKRTERCIFATDGFNSNDLKKLINFLKQRFNLNATIKNGKKLMLNKNESKKFFKIIDDYYLDCMKYKFNPLTTKIKNLDKVF